MLSTDLCMLFLQATTVVYMPAKLDGQWTDVYALCATEKSTKIARRSDATISHHIIHYYSVLLSLSQTKVQNDRFFSVAGSISGRVLLLHCSLFASDSPKFLRFHVVALCVMVFCNRNQVKQLALLFKDEHVHHAWKRQVKRVATFLMRYFFACSIGFTVPVEDFGNVEVWKRASVLLLPLGNF